MPSCAECFERFSLLYLKIINILLFFIAVAVLGVGGYVVSQFSGELSLVSLEAPVVATVVFGACLLVFAVFGILSAVWPDNMVVIGIYIVGTLFLALGVLAAGAALLSYTSFLENIQGANLQFELEEIIVNYELAVFNDCCVEADPDNIPPPVQCDDNLPIFPCITDFSQFQTFTDFIGNTTCEFFSQLEVDGVPLVGDIDAGSCGGGDADSFVVNISSLIEANLQTLGAADISLAVIIMLLTFTACYIFWTDQSKPSGDDDDDDDEDFE